MSETDVAKLKVARTNYEAARREASIQLELAVARYGNVARLDSSISFDQWLETHGFEYRDAREQLAAAKDALYEATHRASSDVRRSKEQLNSARETGLLRLG